nr:immunoglobulin light chain junction region [Macaca mulatta]
CLQYYYFPLTF